MRGARKFRFILTALSLASGCAFFSRGSQTSRVSPEPNSRTSTNFRTYFSFPVRQSTYKGTSFCSSSFSPRFQFSRYHVAFDDYFCTREFSSTAFFDSDDNTQWLGTSFSVCETCFVIVSATFRDLVLFFNCGLLIKVKNFAFLILFIFLFIIFLYLINIK